MMTRRIFFRVGGFDESIKLGEDWDIAHRAGRIAKFRILESVHLIISTRRIEKEGKFIYLTKVIRSNLHQLFKGNITKEGVIDYQFGHYTNVKDKEELHIKLHKLRKKLVKFKYRIRQKQGK